MRPGYDTAVRISRYAWPDGAAEVYLARADNYPDALVVAVLDAVTPLG